MTRIARYWRAQPLYLTLLFAALVMRGLIPAGYMPAPGHGLFALELCTAKQYQMPVRDAQGTPAEHHEHSEARPAPATAAHSHDAGLPTGGGEPHNAGLLGAAAEHHEHGGAHHHEPSSLVASEPHHEHNGATTPGHDSPCPFAATAVCAPAPTIVSHAVALETSAVLASREPQVSTPSRLARSQNARAPPALS